MNTPQPGDRVTITTQSRNHYYKRTSDFTETTYDNVLVLKPFSWLQKHEFCVPSDGPESRFAKIENVERFDRAPDFDPMTMRYEEEYIPSTNLPKFDTRVISMKNVIAINGKPVKKFEESIKTFEISSSRGGTYKVRVENGIGTLCECIGFQFKGRCRHLTEAEEL